MNEISRPGLTYRRIDNSIVELRDTLTGWKSVKTLQAPDEAAIRNWAATRSIPVIEIDPTQVDTGKWTGWYNYWTTVPVSNGDARIAAQVFDFDGNGLPEVYGVFGLIDMPETRIYEIHPDGSSTMSYRYGQNLGLSRQVVDLDRNGMNEVVFMYGPFAYVYEQPTTTSLPTDLKFTFNKYNPNAAYRSIEHMAYMDADTLMDFVHRGTDSTVSQNYLIYVSEYNPSIPNFEKKWYIEPPMTTDWWDGYDVGDYDGDGRMEFLLSSLWGRVWVVENTGDNTYAVTFRDSLPLVNMFYQTSGDVDGDGKREFFVGATMGDGNWTVMYEATGDNTYIPRVMLHLLSGGSLDDPMYVTDDVDGDGRPELVILSGGYLYIFKSGSDDSYYLWYLKKGPSSFSVKFYDMNGDGIKDIVWSRVKNDQWASDVFTGSSLMGVKPGEPAIPQRTELLQNYPNPFNHSTQIDYQVGIHELVSLRVFDVLGRQVATLVNEKKAPGEYHVMWDGASCASGIYILRLETSTINISRKMLLVR